MGAGEGKGGGAVPKNNDDMFLVDLPDITIAIQDEIANYNLQK